VSPVFGNVSRGQVGFGDTGDTLPGRLPAALPVWELIHLRVLIMIRAVVFDVGECLVTSPVSTGRGLTG
jgi:hypothetical protein